MDYTNKHIVKTYANLLEGMSVINKIELIKTLLQSIKKENSAKANQFYKSFGAFVDDKSAEEIISDIKSSRKFIHKDITL